MYDRSPESGSESDAPHGSRAPKPTDACRNVEREVGELLARATIEWIGEPDVRHLRRTLLDVLRMLEEIR
jgi:hypothetical protein